ncbi:GDSL esterase/lipase EXL3 [Vitis vinifera]|uniref:GDSL esterase/lipase EXL3 n=1 Tax=Vitis vinifera TaxID=29760 RepID=A0A438J388_VITVI|nr:GDSL esterase/lipase EXL3 [Vitis vinifera]
MVFLSMELWSSSSIIVFFLSVFIILCTTEALVKLPRKETVPAVLVFGDSIVDPGNNNNLNTLIKSNFPPYGRDLMGGVPTGRFSNGKIPSDFIAEALGIKELVPPYSNAALQLGDLLTGVSFASSGSGFDPMTPKLASVLSLRDQLEMFKEYIRKLKRMVGVERTNTILSKSLFLVVAGSDDIANSYFDSRVQKFQYDVPAYTDLMVTSAASFLKELYGLGARRTVVTSAPPLGCLPSQRSLAGGTQRECAEGHNEAAKLFNFKLSSRLDSLNANFPQAKFVYVDIYKPLLDLIQNPQKSGFEVVDKGCCGSGTIEVAVLCNQLSPFTCEDASTYVFWDSYHPTERAYKVIIDEIIQKCVDSLI